MDQFSYRSQKKALKPPSLLLDVFIKCKNNPYDPITNPRGIINLGTSENKICDDLIIPKLRELVTSISTPEIHYFPLRGLPEFRTELASFIQEKSKCDVKISSDEITVFNGCMGAFSALAYAIGDPGDYFMHPVPIYGMLPEYMSGYAGTVYTTVVSLIRHY